MRRGSGFGPRAKGEGRGAKGATPRTKSRALRGKCGERRAKCYVPRASRYGLRAQGQAPSAQSEPFRAQDQEPSAQGEVRRAKNVGSHPADLGFETGCVTRIESRGRGFAVPPGGEGCEKHKGRIFQSAWWPRGVTSSPKKIPEPGFLAPTRSGRSVAPVGAPTTGSCWLAGFAGYLPAMEIHSGIVQGQILPRGKQPAKPANQRWLQRPTGKLRAQRLELSTSGLARGAR